MSNSMNNHVSVVVAHQVQAILRASGIGVCLDWVSQSIEYLSRKGIVQNDPKLVAAQVYALFLDSDLHEIASNEGVLPMNAQAIESGMLSSSSDDLLILQVDEIINVGSSAAFRCNKLPDDEQTEPIKGPVAGNSRMLKLYLTDGRQQIIGLEVQPMSSLSLELPPGTKVKLRAICTPMRRGVALLSRECLVLLEGSVERLTQSGPVAPTATKTITHIYPEHLSVEKTFPPPVKFTNSLQQQPHVSLAPQLQHAQMQMQPNRTTPSVGHILSSSMPLDTPVSCHNVGDRPTLIIPPASHPDEETSLANHSDSCDHYDAKDEEDVTYMRHHHQPQNRGGGKRRSPHITHGTTLTSSMTDKDDSNVLDLCSPPPTPPIQKPSSSNFMSGPIQCYDELSDSNPNLSMLKVSPNVHSSRKSVIAPRVTLNAPVASTLFSPSPFSSPFGNNPEISSSETALRLVPMDSISTAQSVSASTEISMRVPHGEFLVRGIAVNIRKFKVTANEGYVVLLSLEEDEPDSGRDPGRSKIVLPVTVSSDLCAKYLQLPVKEYLSQHEKLKKEDSKALKIACSLRFRDFRGIFRAKSQQKSTIGPISHQNIGGTNTSSQSTEVNSLLLLDFHCVEA